MKYGNAAINVSASLFTDYGVLLNTGRLQKNSPNPWIQSIYTVYLQVFMYLIFFSSTLFSLSLPLCPWLILLIWKVVQCGIE